MKEDDEPNLQSVVPRKYKFFQNVEYAKDGRVAIIRFDNPEKPVNTISFDMKDEAKLLWDSEIHDNAAVEAVVFSSGKKDGFIAGADIQDIKNICSSPNQEK